MSGLLMLVCRTVGSHSERSLDVGVTNGEFSQ